MCALLVPALLAFIGLGIACVPGTGAPGAHRLSQTSRLAVDAAQASAAQTTVAPGDAVPTPVHLTSAPSVVGNPENGRLLFTKAGCAGCHTIAGVPGANGTTGPVLTNVVLRPTIAGETIPSSPDTMVRWLLNPQAVKPGALMPSVGLTPAEAQDLTAFLYSQPYNPTP